MRRKRTRLLRREFLKIGAAATAQVPAPAGARL
jgi:hypothetical protein